MLVAGSVFALLLMGLAVDGLMSHGPEENDDEFEPDGADGDPFADQTGNAGASLTDLLFPESADAEDSDPEGGDTSPDEADPAPAADRTAPLPMAAHFPDEAEHPASDDDPAELASDTDWTAAADEAAANGDFLEVAYVTDLGGGEEVPYVQAFDTDTDTLILEFDGADEDSPEITIDFEAEEDAALVRANGIPVSLVEGASDMTPDHVRVVMSSEGLDAGTDGALTPAEQPPADQTPPETSAASVPDIADAKPDLPSGPQTLPTDDEMAPPADPLDPADILPDAQDVIPGDVEETVIDPVVDVVDTISDGVPTDDVINGLLDGVATRLTDLGSSSDMLDARTAIDDAFGTSGHDALTGSFNDDVITGTDGQDLLFGDEGDDTLDGGDGNDELHGDFGDDLLSGGDGVDFLDGGDGNDTLDGGADRDLLFGGDGDDVLTGGAADDFLQGGRGADTLNGGSGNDVLDGTFGRDGTDQDDGDVLWGGDGDDTIMIGQGDIAHGGDGADVFTSGAYLETAEIAGSVADFDPGQDRIEVIFDPEINPNPVLEVQDFGDGTGADIILNGEVILSVSGAQGLDPNAIDLRAVA